ncbi:Uncharacterised protein [Stutzerimonas stutzeri]|nr:Uncharacterised protein [Stutzerimonas stutzeri]
MGNQTEIIKLELDGRWGLEELSETIKDYIQLYGFVYSLTPGLPAAREQEIDYLYSKFPWRGGFSTVNFFSNIFHKIPINLRPEISRIQYASPGFIELKELIVIAGSMAAIVTSVTVSIARIHDIYRQIQKGCIEHELSKINLAQQKLSLKDDQVKFAKDSSAALVKALGFDSKQEAAIDKRTQGNHVAKLKILLSVYRRVHPLAQKQAEGKLKLNTADLNRIQRPSKETSK